jgi:hypothetical protein
MKSRTTHIPGEERHAPLRRNHSAIRKAVQVGLRRLHIAIAVIAVSGTFPPASAQPVNAKAQKTIPLSPSKKTGITVVKNKTSTLAVIRSFSVSPQVGTGGTQVLLTGVLPFSGPVAVKFGALLAAYASVNPNGTITAAAPYGGQPGKSVRISVVRSDKTTAESAGLFSYPIAHMEVTGPMPMNVAEVGDARWASGKGHMMLNYAPDTIAFSEQPVFHVSVAFVDDTMAAPASYNPPYAVGNYGLFSAHLQNCDVSRQSSPGPSQCKNWEGTLGTWVDATPSVTLRLDRDKPDVSVSGDLALKTDGLFDQANLVRTLRVAMTLQENDSIRTIGSNRVDSKYGSAFTAVVAPSAFIQVKVIPFTIVYQPPGNASTANYQTTNTYSTSFKLGNSTEQNNSSSSQQTESTKASIKLTIPIDGSSVGFGYDMGESWDTTTKIGFGTAESSTDTAANTMAFQTQWSMPANTDLIPGSGATCVSATDCSTQTPAANPRAIEPFWSDTFVFLVHPQFAMWLLDAGKTRYVQIAAVPVTVDATVTQLAACWLGSTDWPGASPCDLQYAESILESKNGAPVTYVGTQNHVSLTAEEAHRFLLLDPFFQAGQGADVPPTRGTVLTSVNYGAQIGQKPRPVTETLTRTLAQTSDTSGSTSTTLSVTSVRGTDASFNVAESLYGILSGGATVTNGSKSTVSADMKATFNTSTAVTITNATQAQAVFNDLDTTSGCSMPHCHLPLPSRPNVNVYLDKQFGGFLFQDPGATAGSGAITLTAAALKERTELAVAAVKRGALQAAKPVLDGRFIQLKTNASVYDLINQKPGASPLPGLSKPKQTPQ